MALNESSLTFLADVVIVVNIYVLGADLVKVYTVDKSRKNIC